MGLLDSLTSLSQTLRGSVLTDGTSVLGTAANPLVVQSVSAVPANNFNVYADANTGDDSQDGLTPATAVLTLRRALSIPVPNWAAYMTVNLAVSDSSYPWSDPGNGRGNIGIQSNRGVGPDGVFPVIVGGFTDELGTRTASDSTSQTSIKDSTLTLSTDQYRKYYVSCLTGVNAGQRRQIKHNTTDGEFQLSVGFSDPVTAGDTFVIENCGVQIDCDGADLGAFGIAGPTIGFKGIRWNVTSGFWFAYQNANVTMEGCQIELNGNAMILDYGASLSAQSFPVPFGALNPANPFSFLRTQAGVSISDGALLMFNGAGAIQGYYVMDNMFCQSGETAEQSYSNLSAQNCTFIAYEGMFNVFGGENGVRSEIVGGGGVTLSRKSVGTLDSLDISGASGDAILVNKGSFANIGDVGGSGNGGVGIHIDVMSNATYVPEVTSVTGSSEGQDTMVGTTVKAYGDLGAGFTDDTNCRIEAADVFVP